MGKIIATRSSRCPATARRSLVAAGPHAWHLEPWTTEPSLASSRHRRGCCAPRDSASPGARARGPVMLGVDGGNVRRALRLYRSAGFRRVQSQTDRSGQFGWRSFDRLSTSQDQTTLRIKSTWETACGDRWGSWRVPFKILHSRGMLLVCSRQHGSCCCGWRRRKDGCADRARPLLERRAGNGATSATRSHSLAFTGLPRTVARSEPRSGCRSTGARKAGSKTWARASVGLHGVRLRRSRRC